MSHYKLKKNENENKRRTNNGTVRCYLHRVTTQTASQTLKHRNNVSYIAGIQRFI